MKKEIKDLFYGVIFCIIIDTVYVAIGIYNKVPVSDYILMSIFLPIIDFLFIGLISLTFEDIQLPNIIDNELPKLKKEQKKLKE